MNALPESEPPAFAIAMIALKGPPPTPLRSLIQEAARSHPRLKLNREPESPGGVTSFQWESSDVLVADMPAPIPWSDLEGPCRTAWFWPAAAEEIKTHTCHLLVTLTDPDLDAIDRFLRLTEVTAALLASLPTAAGVYWGSGAVVTSPEAFREMASGAVREQLPLYLWVTFHLGRNGDGSMFGFTQGLAALGIKELEVPSTRYSTEDVLDRLFNIAHYVLDGVAEVKDGNSIGMSATEVIRVRFRSSQFGQDGMVMQLEFPK